jgi:two-component system sensor histidine kinase DesK
MHAPFVAFPAVVASTGLFRWLPAGGVIPVALGLGAGAIQIRHSLSAANGENPAHWPLTMAALAGLAYLPVPWLGAAWISLQWFVGASILMRFPNRMGATLVAAMILLDGVGYVAALFAPDQGIAFLLFLFLYPVVFLAMGSGALFAASRLTRLARELRNARADLAAIAVTEERLRISQDVHDLLGHALSALILKGELALRLYERGEGERARAEVNSVADVARQALQDLRNVTRSVRQLSFASALDFIPDFLESAGIAVRVQSISLVDSAATELLAWALREAATNLLEHSSASRCLISVDRDRGFVRLVVENDGVEAVSARGHGLAGLATRAERLGGTLLAGPTSEGMFRLTVEVPETVS